MFTRTKLAGLALLAALVVPAAASADTAIAVTNLNLRAGPGTRYPVATTMPAGAGVEVYGCLPDYSWCDIDYAGIRGWVAAQYLERGGQVLVPAYARIVRVPTVTYSFDTYWYEHYRNRPFYRQRDTYRNWDRSPYRAPPAFVGNGYPRPGIYRDRRPYGGPGVFVRPAYGRPDGGDRHRERDHRPDDHRSGNGDRADHQGRRDDQDRGDGGARNQNRDRGHGNAGDNHRKRDQVCVRGVCTSR